MPTDPTATAAGPTPAELLDARHDDPDPTGPLTDFEPQPTTAAHTPKESNMTQPHTFPGQRGSTPLSVVGDGGRALTYRDAHNAVLVGLNRAAGRPDDADPYGHNLDDIDPVAAAQNAAVYLEELAGIYPNVPELEPVDGT